MHQMLSMKQIHKKIPPYVRVNDQFREWWVEKMKYPSKSPGHASLVLKAFQDHSEALRAWAILIDRILNDELNLKNCIMVVLMVKRYCSYIRWTSLQLQVNQRQHQFL